MSLNTSVRSCCWPVPLIAIESVHGSAKCHQVKVIGFLTPMPFTVGLSKRQHSSTSEIRISFLPRSKLGRRLTAAQEQEFSQALGKDFTPFKKHQ